MLRRFLILAITAALAACTLPAPSENAAPPDLSGIGKIVLLRHADRDSHEVVLNETGIARAAALPAALADLEIDAILLPDLSRNRDTAAPLAAARGLTPRIVDTANDLVGQLARAAAGRSVVWVGNSNNLRALWDALALPGDGPFTYGEIAILSPAPGGGLNVERRRFDP